MERHFLPWRRSGGGIGESATEFRAAFDVGDPSIPTVGDNVKLITDLPEDFSANGVRIVGEKAIGPIGIGPGIVDD